jgi:hypothetical protein
MKSNQKIAALAGVATALLICCSMGAYALANYATLFQIQPVNATNNTQTVALSSGCTLGADTGSTVNLTAATVSLPGINLSANTGTIPSGDTLTAAAGSTVNLSSGTLTLPTFQGVNFAGSNGTANISLVNSSSGQKVLTIWDVTGGTATAASTATPSSFAATITGSGVLTQTSTANLSGRVYSAILVNQGP